MTTTVEDVIRAVRERMCLPDPVVLLAVLAAWAANLMGGEMLWLLLVGPPSSGKSEIVGLLTDLPQAHQASDLSLAGLLTRGGRDDDEDLERKGRGLLRDVGDFGVIVALELSTLISEGQRADSKVFGALREIATDHRYTRIMNGQRLEWEGRCGFIGAVTEAIDELGMGSLGERFVYCRTPEVSDEELMEATLRALDPERPRDMADARAAVGRLFEGLVIPDTPPDLDEGDQARVMMLAYLVARCRSGVTWGPGRDEMVDIPQPERPMRLALVSRQLLQGLRLIGVDDAEAWRVVRHVALGSIRTRRRRILQVLLAVNQPMMASGVAVRARLPESSVRRELQELNAHGVVDQVGDRPVRWTASDQARQSWADVVALAGEVDLASLRYGSVAGCMSVPIDERVAQ